MSSFVEITLNLESESNFELFQTVKSALRAAALAKKPKILSIDLVGVRQISQDIVLAIWDLVQDAKKGGLKVITRAYSSLYDGSLLLTAHRRYKKNTKEYCVYPTGQPREVRKYRFFRVNNKA